MAEARHELGDAEFFECAIENDLARGGGQQVFAAQNVRDLHQCIVDRVHQRVERVTIGANDDVVRNRAGLEGDFTADQVVERDVFVGHAHAQNRLAAFSLECSNLFFGEVTVEAVVAELRVFTLCAMTFFDFFGGGVGLVGETTFEELCCDIGVDVHALGLAVRAVRATLVDSFVPIKAKPCQGVEDLVERFLGIASSVGVFDTENEGAAGVARVCPVEQAGSDHSHVGCTGR